MPIPEEEGEETEAVSGSLTCPQADDRFLWTQGTHTPPLKTQDWGPERWGAASKQEGLPPIHHFSKQLNSGQRTFISCLQAPR